MGRAMNGTYTKVPDAYAQAVEAYKMRDEGEFKARQSRYSTAFIR